MASRRGELPNAHTAGDVGDPAYLDLRPPWLYSRADPVSTGTPPQKQRATSANSVCRVTTTDPWAKGSPLCHAGPFRDPWPAQRHGQTALLMPITFCGIPSVFAGPRFGSRGQLRCFFRWRNQRPRVAPSGCTTESTPTATATHTNSNLRPLRMMGPGPWPRHGFRPATPGRA